MPIKEKTLNSWEKFEEIIAKEKVWRKEQIQNPEILNVSPLLFRGHARQSWALETTLERYVKGKPCKQNYSWQDYFSLLESVKQGVLAFTGQNYDLPKKFEQGTYAVDSPPGYSFMIYLRHHGFPSPLLDWTESPYIAAFFAFNEASSEESPAIFTFREYIDGGKGGFSETANVHGLGPYVDTHKRHYQQQCQYTVCYKQDNTEDKKRTYCPHEDADLEVTRQDRLCKYIIPHTEREKVMAKLDAMNINAFSLFGNEEGLAQMLAYKEIEGREGF